jgi:ubiquinone/menaquinone biosynthesis C-methylase UbiE
MGETKDIKEAVKQTFGLNAEKYITSETHSQGSDLVELIDWLQPRRDWVALDIATGGGHVTKALSPHVGHIFASDLTQQMLQNTSAHLNKYCNNVWYVIADAEVLPFLDNTFDCVICRIAPHHFPNPQKFVLEAGRVLKPGGKFLLIDNIVPNNDEYGNYMNTFEKLRDESHVRALSIIEWREHFATANLKEIQSDQRRKKLIYPSWVERTTTSQEQIERVTNYILNTDEETLKYFSVIREGLDIKSLEIDEWMALCGKPLENI